MRECSVHLPDADATAAWACRLARALPASLVVALEGDLGAGKTTLVRAVLRTLGHTGPVPSPTYTLVEPYALGDRRCVHLDLYRLADPEELEFVGIRDLLADEAVLFIEWPSKGEGLLPPVDLSLLLAREGRGRRLCQRALTERGSSVLEDLT